MATMKVLERCSVVQVHTNEANCLLGHSGHTEHSRGKTHTLGR